MGEQVKLILSYGTASVPVSFAGLSRPGAPAVVLDLGANQPLRISDVEHPFALPPAAQDLSRAARQLECIETHLQKLCGLWNRPLQGFVSRYFDGIRAVIRESEADLVTRAGPLSGLVEPLHWGLAAPMPLPRAHVGLDTGGAIAGSDAANLVTVDILFLDSRGLVAVETGLGTETPRQRREREALEAAGVRVLHLSADLRGPDLLDALGPDFRDFTASVDLPRSPFRGRGVPDPVS